MIPGLQTDTAVPAMILLLTALHARCPGLPGKIQTLTIWTLAGATVSAVLVRLVAGLYSSHGFGFDNAYVYNSLWNLSRGSWLYCDTIGQPLLSVHSFLNMPLLFPFYLLGHPVFLNAGHLLIGFSTIVPIYVIARDLFGERSSAAAAATAFLLLPSTSGFLLVECQPSITGVPFLFAYLLYRDRKRRLPATLCALLAAFGYEPFILAILVEGVAETLRPSIDRRFGLTLLLAGGFAGLLFALNSAGYDSVSGSRHYSTLDGSPLNAVRLIITSPSTIFGLMVTKAKLGYLVHLLFPLLFLPLASPRALLMALPELALVLLSDPGDDMHKINCFYSHVTTVALMYAALRSLSRLRLRLLSANRAIFVLLLHVSMMHFTYHHTLMKLTASDLVQIASNRRNEFEPLVPLNLVPEGARVYVTAREGLYLLPRRRAACPDDFLAPVVYRDSEQWLDSAEYLVTPSNRSVPRGDWAQPPEIFHQWAIYRRSPSAPP